MKNVIVEDIKFILRAAVLMMLVSTSIVLIVDKVNPIGLVFAILSIFSLLGIVHTYAKHANKPSTVDYDSVSAQNNIFYKSLQKQIIQIREEKEKVVAAQEYTEALKLRDREKLLIDVLNDLPAHYRKS